MSEAPFPCDADEDGITPVAETPWAGLAYAKGGFWTGAESPMILNTFARIVHGTLLNWWRWLADQPRIALTE